MSSKDEHEKEKEKEKENENENEKWKWKMKMKNENENDKTLIIKKLNDSLDEIIDKSKSFEEQIESVKKSRKSKWVSFYRRLWR